ncbi:hypothetical protein ABG839_20805 [Phocaeicola vulgatus]|nr:hypothetical protein [Phocaeicola vulgatus]MDB0935402.1 hypothetical protein [Phocaeicola vulgatus]MDB0940741.1 hypothetical protein [Phocaeicola vulgatus]
MVQLKKKVTLKTKRADSDVKQDIQPKNTVPQEPVNKTGGGNKRNLWVFLGIVVLAAILFFVFVGKDNETSVKTNVAQNHVTAKADSIQPAKTEETAEKVDSTNVEKTDNTLKEEPTKATAEMPASESNSKQSSKPDVVKEEKKTQTSSAIPVNGSLEQKAIAVIRGTYGNGLERKQKLGDEYTVIQNKVNEMYRDGLVD